MKHDIGLDISKSSADCQLGQKVAMMETDTVSLGTSVAGKTVNDSARLGKRPAQGPANKTGRTGD
jgi:hypothetical protein